MKNYLATAMALALVAGVAGLSAVPLVSAGHSNCHEDFEIADSEASAGNRNLDADEIEIGLEDVSSGTPETLSMGLRSIFDRLEVKVYELDGTTCTDVTSEACPADPVVLDSFNEEATCDLDAPKDLDYFVHFENAQSTDGLVYETWSET